MNLWGRSGVWKGPVRSPGYSQACELAISSTYLRRALAEGFNWKGSSEDFASGGGASLSLALGWDLDVRPDQLSWSAGPLLGVLD